MKEVVMIELTRMRRAMEREIVRLRRALAWAWLAIAALSFVAVGACVFAWMISRVG